MLDLRLSGVDWLTECCVRYRFRPLLGCGVRGLGSARISLRGVNGVHRGETHLRRDMVRVVRTLIGSPSFMQNGFFGTTPFSILNFLNNCLTYALHFDVHLAVYCGSTKSIKL